MKLRVVIASLAVHAAIFACMMREEGRVVVPTAAEPVASPELEIEAPALDPQTPTTTEATSNAEPTAAMTTTLHRSSGGPASVGSAVPSAASSAEALGGQSSTWVVDLGNAVVQPFHAQQSGGGFGPTRQWQEEQDRALQLPHKDDGLKRALALQDAAKGLGADGPVLHALEDETRRSLAPLRGSATFHAIVDATGFVTSLTITDNSGDIIGWNDARDLALAALQKKKLDLRGATNGVAFDILVESKMRLPAGNEVTEFGVQDGMLTMGGDLSNVGSKASRVVHARLTNYTPL